MREAVVWAIAERLLHNYLLPRDCPRVTFYAGPRTSAADRGRFLGTSSAAHVVAVESRWLHRIRSTRLWLYELPAETFSETDAGAGYHVSASAVDCIAATEVADLLDALVTRDIELRVLPDLWPLRDAVAASSLAFSMIRMRNAAPRTQPAVPPLPPGRTAT